MKVEGIAKLISQLAARIVSSNREDKVSVSVGYTAEYALHVHENMDAHHPVGQAKYLEEPARSLANSGELSRILTKARQQGRTTSQGLLLAGLRIQRESQILCPVDTGNLRGSAYTKLDAGGM